MKTETYKLYSGVFWILLPNLIKIDPYNFELCIPFQSWHVFFETQCRYKISSQICVLPTYDSSGGTSDVYITLTSVEHWREPRPDKSVEYAVTAIRH